MDSGWFTVEVVESIFYHSNDYIPSRLYRFRGEIQDVFYEEHKVAIL